MNNLKIFIALNKRKALKRAMDFWHKHLSEEITLKTFISYCTWCKVGKEYQIIYRSNCGNYNHYNRSN